MMLDAKGTYYLVVKRIHECYSGNETSSLCTARDYIRIKYDTCDLSAVIGIYVYEIEATGSDGRTSLLLLTSFVMT